MSRNSDTGPPEQQPGSAMLIDQQTIDDLRIFSKDDNDRSIFQLCNSTRSSGGAKALRRRMAQPFAEVRQIRATQISLQFIMANRRLFDALPSAWLMGRTDHYINDIQPIVTATNPVEFHLEALSLWWTQNRYYLGIVHGTRLCHQYLLAVTTFLQQPELQSATGELRQLLDDLSVALQAAQPDNMKEPGKYRWFGEVLREDQHFRLFCKPPLQQLLKLLYELDALIALADTSENNNLTMPQVMENELFVTATGLRHPLLDNPVSNPLHLSQQGRVLFLTGPNMAGKTTYLRAFATAIYMAHLGMGVPAASFQFSPADVLFSSISLSDDQLDGISYFRAEALRVRDIARAVGAGQRVVAVLDEPFKGTNVKDALDASQAIIERFAVRPDCLFIFSSHLIELSDVLQDHPQVDCRYFEADEREGRLRFDYRIHQGISLQRLGMRVLEEEGIFEALDSLSPGDP
ncbi:MAG: hypothetical protein KDI36_15165 [Pseudomonadales bacterium]|nr:hypothetical protein [Pseudomonadales bacterium]